jgi:hypothetical protein
MDILVMSFILLVTGAVIARYHRMDIIVTNSNIISAIIQLPRPITSITSNWPFPFVVVIVLLLPAPLLPSPYTNACPHHVAMEVEKTLM